MLPRFDSGATATKSKRLSCGGNSQLCRVVGRRLLVLSRPSRRGDHRTEAYPMTTPGAAGGSSPSCQPVPAALTRAAIFLVVTVNPGDDNAATVRSLCADLATLLRAIGFREPAQNLSCIMGFGSAAWDRLFGGPRPAELHPFREFRAGSRHA